MGRAKRRPGRGEGSDGDPPIEDATRLRARVAELERQLEAATFQAQQLELVGEQFADLYDYAPVGYATINRTGTIHRVNVAAAALLGASRQEICGTRICAYVRPDEKKSCAAFVARAFATSSPTSIELCLAKGKWRAEQVQLLASQAASGRDLGHAGAQARIAIIDVTSRRRAEDALRAGNRVDGTGGGRASPRGGAAEAGRAGHATDVGSPRSRKHKSNARRHLRVAAEAEVLRGKGAKAPALSPAELFQELQVHQVEMEMQNEELRRAQLAVEEARDQYVDLYDFAPVGYFSLDGRGLVTRANLTGAGLLGVDRGKVTGRPFSEFVGPECADRWHVMLSHQLRTDAERQVGELPLRRADGSVFDALLSIRTRVDDGTGSVVQVAVSDLTDQKRSRATTWSPERVAAMQSAIDGLPIGVAILEARRDGTLRIVSRNQASEAFAGPAHPVGPLHQGQPFRIFHPDRVTQMAPRDWPSFRAAWKGETVRDAEVHLLRGSQWTVLSVSAVPIPRLDPAEPRRAVSVLLDVTERIEQARQVREIQARLAEALDGSATSHFEWNLATGRVNHGRTFAAMLGYEPTDLGPGDEAWRKVIHPGDRPRLQEAMGRCVRGETELFDEEVRIRHRDGRWISVAVRGGIVERDAAAVPIRIAGTYRDVTERRRAEEALAASDARFRRLFETVTDGVVVVDMQGFIRESNEVYRRMLGYTEQEMKTLTYEQITPARWHAFEARIVADEILVRGHSRVYEKEYRRKDGSVFPVELRTFLIQEAGGPSAMWAIVRDVTERKQAEADLRERDYLLLEAQRIAHVGTWSLDLDTGARAWSEETFRIFGLPAARGAPSPEEFRRLVHPDDWARLEGWMRARSSNEGPSVIEYRALLPDGSVRTLEGRGDRVERTPLRGPRLIGTVQDVTGYGRPGQSPGMEPAP